MSTCSESSEFCVACRSDICPNDVRHVWNQSKWDNIYWVTAMKASRAQTYELKQPYNACTITWSVIYFSSEMKLHVWCSRFSQAATATIAVLYGSAQSWQKQRPCNNTQHLLNVSTKHEVSLTHRHCSSTVSEMENSCRNCLSSCFVVRRKLESRRHRPWPR